MKKWEQNIYDNPIFFEGYRKLRNSPSAVNDIIEKPFLFSLCPDFSNKTVLDLGCGYGENCRRISEMGATSVLGIDISEKMLSVAENENQCGNISFMRMSMSDISSLNMKFDIILSSLAIHYIEDFDKLVADIYSSLNKNGIFIFSQEHPFTTALMKGPYWSRDSEGNILHYNLTDYSIPGERRISWIVDGVIKYHRSFSSILNSLSTAGFIIEKVLEPLPDKDIMEQYPAYKKYNHKPDFLLIRVRKDSCAK